MSNAIEIPMFNSTASDFEQTITLGTQELSLRLAWNTRAGFWYLDIGQADGTPLLSSRKLLPIVPIVGFQYRARCPIDGDFVLVPESDTSPEFPTFDGLGTTHKLYWLPQDEADAWMDSLGIR